MEWFLSLAASFMALALLGFGVRLVDSLDIENQMAEAQLRTARMYDEALEKRIQEIRRFCHDVNGLLQAIEFAQFKAGQANNTPRDGDTTTTPPDDLQLLHAVLDMKRRQCDEAQIAFTCKASPLLDELCRRAHIEEADLVAVLQNLLENAYEANLEIDAKAKRFISVQLDGEGDTLCLVVRNRTAQSEMPTFVTTKQNAGEHGVGLRVVEETAALYGGIVRPRFEASGNTLEMRVELPGR